MTYRRIILGVKYNLMLGGSGHQEVAPEQSSAASIGAHQVDLPSAEGLGKERWWGAVLTSGLLCSRQQSLFLPRASGLTSWPRVGN